MTVTESRREDRTRYLESLLPTHVLERDDATGHLLQALLGAVAGELAVVEQSLEGLYDSWFVETAPEWVIPYLADLVGLVGLPGDLGAQTGAGVSRRAVVANTVRYRQRKGTVGVLEQVVSDVTGWPAKAVEFYRLLGTTTHVNHVRTERPVWGSVRDAASAELESRQLAAGALTRFAHTADVRHVEPGPNGGRGRYNIPHVGIFEYPVQVYEATSIPARSTPDGWATHPLGLHEPWFALPETEATIEHLALEADLAVPLRPRRLLAALEAARAAGTNGASAGEPVPLRVVLDADPLPPERIRVCGLEDLARTGPAGTDPTLPGWQVMVDPVRGLVRPYLDGVATAPPSLHVDYSYGAMADVGAGTYDRSLGHDEALSADPYTGDVDRGGDRVLAQVAVRTAGPPPPDALSTITAAITATETAWNDPVTPTTGGTSVVSVTDSEPYPGDLPVSVPAETRLLLVAADWRGRTLLNGVVEAPAPGVYSPAGLRPRIIGDLVITGLVGPTGESGSAVLLDGLVVEGDVRVDPGLLGSLTVSQCTIAGRIVASGTTAGPNRELSVLVRRSLVGGIDLADSVPQLSVVDSVIDAQLASAGGGAAGAAIVAPGAHVVIAGSTLLNVAHSALLAAADPTVLGSVDCRLLDVTSSICDGVVTVIDRQAGCARFSYLEPGSRAPRRFRCVPATDALSGPEPSYRDTDPGSPSYAALAPTTPGAIRRGGEYTAEMGVHHHLRRPLRLDAARRLVEPYVPAGMQIGLFGS